MSKGPLVGIVMGSANDVETLQVAKKTLEEFGVAVEMRALSAHRSPDDAIKWAKEAKAKGMKVLIASAGMAAHLAGVVAANTTLPVIGVPLPGGVLDGLDSLLSTVQMPKGTPVGTVAVGKAGAANAALLALRILALTDSTIDTKVAEHKAALRDETLKGDEGVRSR